MVVRGRLRPACAVAAHTRRLRYGTYTLDNPVIPPNPAPNCGNWCVQGPFVGYRYSHDNGNTWTEPRLRMKNATDNLFGETAMNNSKVKFGAPHVVDLGQELRHSPDGKMYIVGHGAVRPEAHQSWMQGDQVYMARVKPSVDAIGDGKQWCDCGYGERQRERHFCVYACLCVCSLLTYVSR